MYKIISHPRGAIYFCNIEFAEGTDIKGIQSGNRPCVVISNDDGNSTSDVVTVALITSKENKSNLSINVPFINWNGEENVVLCNQLHTVNKKWLTSKCFGVMPEKLMKEVDKALTISLGLKTTSVDISDITSTVDKIIKAKVSEINSNKTDVTQETVSKIAEQLEKMFIEVLVPAKEKQVKAIKESAPVLNAYVESKLVTETKNVNKVESKQETKVITLKKPKGFWTDQNKREFIRDKETMPLSDLKAKWKIDNPKSIYQMYYKFKKDINENEASGGNS